MIDKEIEAIIFDYGGVLINLDYQSTIDAFEELGISNFDEMYSQAAQSNLFNDIETGQITPSYFVNSLLEFLPKGTSKIQVINAWNAMIKNVPRCSIHLIESLQKKGYQLFLLSNTNQLHIDIADREWNKVSHLTIQSMFDAVYYSHEIKMRKPNREIFEFVCNQNQLTPSKTLFVDDSIQHIEGARKIGLKTIHLEKMADLQVLFS
ncbi:MAG TPA: HAD family phosphatase [Crocinitomicaceae bacterium]|nr:HAD family phosphatase [Crocinitomicaceae bacterium]